MDTIKVQRANIELDINPEEKEYYMKQGYSVVNEYGQVIEQSLPNDVNALKIMVASLQKEIAMLKAAKQEVPVKEVAAEKPKAQRKSTKQ